MYSIMITGKVIKEVYKKYRKCPSTLDCIEFNLLDGSVSEVHNIQIQDNRLIIGSIDEKSPFHSLPLNKIHGIVNFEKCVAIVFHSSILFLDKKEDKVQIHLKMEKPSIWQRLMMCFCREK